MAAASSESTATRVVGVTGASGFVGRHLCRHLLSEDLSVRGSVRDASKKAPEAAEIHLEGGRHSAEKLAGQVVDYLERQGFIPAASEPESTA